MKILSADGADFHRLRRRKKGNRHEAEGISKKGNIKKDSHEKGQKAQKGVKFEKRISKYETNSNYRNIKYWIPRRRQGAEILGRNVGMLLWPEAGMRNLQFYVRAKLWNK